MVYNAEKFRLRLKGHFSYRSSCNGISSVSGLSYTGSLHFLNFLSFLFDLL